MDTYSIKKGYGDFQWFVVRTDAEGNETNVSEHTDRGDAEMAKFAKECEF